MLLSDMFELGAKIFLEISDCFSLDLLYLTLQNLVDLCGVCFPGINHVFLETML